MENRALRETDDRILGFATVAHGDMEIEGLSAL
jgi:hypothetical protein